MIKIDHKTNIDNLHEAIRQGKKSTIICTKSKEVTEM